MDSHVANFAQRRSRQKVQSFFARRRTRSITHPIIRLSGRYLARYGFDIGDMVEISCENGRIEIRKVENKKT